MANSDKLIQTGSIREVVLQSFLRAGPWALLSLIMIGGLGYMLHEFIATAGPAVAQYVTASRRIDEQNAKAVLALTAAEERVSMEHESMLAGITSLQQAIDLRHEEHETQTAEIAKLLAMIDSAYSTMSVIPQQRADQLKLLAEIKAGIDELRASVDRTNGYAEATDDPG
jgi:hypothetical protein